MSTVKVAINGFGRIGRLVYRQIFDMKGIDIVAINDLTSPKVLAHLLKYDTAQGRFDKDVKATENSIIVEGDEIKIRRIYLAYYDAGIYTEFLQPIYVFEGDNDFVAYTPAITSNYYSE